MGLHRQRRIFRSSARPARSRRGSRLPWLLAIALIGVGAGGSALYFQRQHQKPAASPLAAAVAAPPAQVAVVDGETLRLKRTVVHLLGVDAPSRGVQCRRDDGSVFDCGAASAQALAVLVRDRSVICMTRGRDHQGRALGICATNGSELNRALVLAGWARAAGTAPPGLHGAEAAARAKHRGLWNGSYPAS